MIVILNNEFFGQGDEVLGKKLMARESHVLDALTGLYEKGVEIIGCGTCIDHFNLEDEIMVGRTTDMVEIVDMITKADKVVTV
ncbi:MAG: DsrE family protein [Vallitaleaceae bacterium]|nr:DsrE family protein [Vallitaleaceae bacterium]